MGGKALAIAAITVAASGLAACGEEANDETPVACLGGAAPFRQALNSAPGDVLLEGKTKISDCLVAGQSGGELADAGQAIILSATQLNEAARKDPTGPQAVQLGYLVGAVQQGASDSGIHADLVRRLDAAARFTPTGSTLSASFERTFGEGYAAGQQSG